MTETLIDLGEMPVGADYPHRPRRGRRAPVPAARPLLGLLSAVLLTLLAGAVAHHPPAPPTTIPATPGDNTFVAGDRLFVVTTTGPAARNRVVSAYALPAVRLLSRTPVDISGDLREVRPAGDILVISYHVDGAGGIGTAGVTTGTGEVRWRRPADLDAVSAADGVALLSTQNNDSRETGRSAIDLHTGVLRWSVQVPADGDISDVGGGGTYPDWVVSAGASGHVEVRDARTGAVRAGADLPSAADPAPADPAAGDSPAQAYIWTAGDLVIAVTGPGRLTAYGLPDLRQRWSTTGIDISEPQALSLRKCGPAICATQFQREISALDPATGRLLWHSDRWGYAVTSGPYLLAVSAVEMDLGLRKLVVLDPRTGAVRGDFGEWIGLETPGSGEVTYGIRPAAQENAFYYGVFDPSRPFVHPLGTARQTPGQCETSLDLLICRRLDGSVGVWHLR